MQEVSHSSDLSIVLAGEAGQGIQLIEARQVPPNDGGLAVGQAWVALQHLVGRQGSAGGCA